jgi:AcrR family transcriptional regulator
MGDMADKRSPDETGWDSADTKRLKKELRDEAVRLRDELKAEWQRQLAIQMEEFREQGGARRRETRSPGMRGGRPHARGGREPLSRERIVDEAMAIMGSEGLDKVTMRKVAWALDTGPASIYAHIRSMSELHGHMLDRILAGLDLDDSEGSWREQLSRLLIGYTQLLLETPELARSAVAARPAGHHYLALVERLLSLLDEGGIEMARAAWGVDLLLAWATANAAEHAETDDEAAREAEWEALRTAITHAEKYPHVSALGLDLLGGTGPERSAWIIDALINGIAATPRG